MPALVNIRVGSLIGTSGEDGTAVWPFRTKKSTKADLISLTLLIRKFRLKCLLDLSDSPLPAAVCRFPLLSRPRCGVQKGESPCPCQPRSARTRADGQPRAANRKSLASGAAAAGRPLCHHGRDHPAVVLPAPRRHRQSAA